MTTKRIVTPIMNRWLRKGEQLKLHLAQAQKELEQQQVELRAAEAAAQGDGPGRGPGSDAMYKAQAVRHQLSATQVRIQVTEADLRRVEGILALRYEGSAKLVEVLDLKHELTVANEELEQELSDARAEVDRLRPLAEQAELQQAIKEEFGSADSDSEVTSLKAALNEAYSRTVALERRLAARKAAETAAGKLAGVVTPAAELEARTREMWDQCEGIQSTERNEWTLLLGDLEENLSKAEAIAERLGQVKARLMLLDEDLMDAGFNPTDAHKAMHFIIPTDVELRLRKAFYRPIEFVAPH